ncbi:MAG: aldo/keto reductase, partial [Clostridia bacterium]|nr:aldo/keto reductase [Clostridia bacterium]
MIYRDFKGKKLSMLGLGCMRLPGEGRFTAVIDEDATAEMVDYCIKNGLNYFDTAYGYHGKQSEFVMGKILKNYPRESFYLATKFPGFSADYTDKIEEIFEEQLKKLQMDYVDFYLFHNLNDGCIEQYLDPKYRMMEYMKDQKAKGRIKHIGVSVHSSHESLKRFLDAYGDDIEFCQLQLNWLDWDYQDVKAKVKMLNERNIPIWVMEPLRGGKLASLPEKHEKELKKLRPEEEIPAWSFRFLQAVPGVTVVLSGMSDFKQLKENIETFDSNAPP